MASHVELEGEVEVEPGGLSPVEEPVEGVSPEDDDGLRGTSTQTRDDKVLGADSDQEVE